MRKALIGVLFLALTFAAARFGRLLFPLSVGDLTAVYLVLLLGYVTRFALLPTLQRRRSGKDGEPVRFHVYLTVILLLAFPPAVFLYFFFKALVGEFGTEALPQILFGTDMACVFWAVFIAYPFSAVLVLMPFFVVSMFSVNWLMTQYPGFNRFSAARYLFDVQIGVYKAQYLVAKNEIKQIRPPAGALSLLGGPGLLLVEEGHAVITMRGGRVDRIVGTGITYLKPFERPHQVVYLLGRPEKPEVTNVVTRDHIVIPKINLRVFHRLDRGDQSHKNGDLSFEDRIIRERVWSPNAGDWRDSVSVVADGALRDVVARHPLEEVVSVGADARTRFKRELVDAMNAITARLGVTVASVDFGVMQLPPEAEQELLERGLGEVKRRTIAIAAEAEHDQIVTLADAERYKKVAEAHGEHSKVLALAEAERNSSMLKAEADRVQHVLAAEGEKQSRITLSEGAREARFNEGEAEKMYTLLMGEAHKQTELWMGEVTKQNMLLKGEAEREIARWMNEIERQHQLLKGEIEKQVSKWMGEAERDNLLLKGDAQRQTELWIGEVQKQVMLWKGEAEKQVMLWKGEAEKQNLLLKGEADKQIEKWMKEIDRENFLLKGEIEKQIARWMGEVEKDKSLWMGDADTQNMLRKGKADNEIEMWKIETEKQSILAKGKANQEIALLKGETDKQVALSKGEADKQVAMWKGEAKADSLSREEYARAQGAAERIRQLMTILHQRNFSTKDANQLLMNSLRDNEIRRLRSLAMLEQQMYLTEGEVDKKAVMEETGASASGQPRQDIQG